MVRPSFKGRKSTRSNDKSEAVFNSILIDSETTEKFRKWFSKSKNCRGMINCLNNGGKFSLRRETKNNRPIVYGVQLQLENVKNYHGRIHPWCFLKIGMSHQASDTRIRSIRSSLKNRFRSFPDKPAAKEIFRLPVDPFAKCSIFKVESKTRTEFGMPLCHGLATHLQLPNVREWVMTRQNDINRLITKTEKDKRQKQEMTTKIFRSAKWQSKDHEDIPKELFFDEKKGVVCFRTKMLSNIEYTENNKQYLFTKHSFKKRKSAKKQTTEYRWKPPRCMHSKLLSLRKRGNKRGKCADKLTVRI